MPVLIDTVAEDLDELLQDGSLTTIALLRKFGRVVVMAVHIAFVLVVGILCTKDSRAYTASEMLNVVFAVHGSNVGAS